MNDVGDILSACLTPLFSMKGSSLVCQSFFIIYEGEACLYTKFSCFL